MERDFLFSIPGLALVLMVRLIISSILLCYAVELFNFKSLKPFLSFKRVSSVCLLILAVRIGWGIFTIF